MFSIKCSVQNVQCNMFSTKLPATFWCKKRSVNSVKLYYQHNMFSIECSAKMLTKTFPDKVLSTKCLVQIVQHIMLSSKYSTQRYQHKVFSGKIFHKITSKKLQQHISALNFQHKMQICKKNFFKTITKRKNALIDKMLKLCQ